MQMVFSENIINELTAVFADTTVQLRKQESK